MQMLVKRDLKSLYLNQKKYTSVKIGHKRFRSSLYSDKKGPFIKSI